MARSITPAALLALFLFGAVAFRGVVQNAPAFVEEQQIESITGDSRLQYTPAMYDRAQYLFQVAYGYLIADALPFGNLEGSEAVATFDVAGARIDTARDLLLQSLRLDPADGYTWQFYAQAEAALGETQAARMALSRSKELAPHTPLLALQRLLLIGGIQELAAGFGLSPLTDRERQIHADDVQVLQTLRPQFLAGIPPLAD